MGRTACTEPVQGCTLPFLPQHKVGAQYIQYIQEFYFDTALAKGLKEQRLYWTYQNRELGDIMEGFNKKGQYKDSDSKYRRSKKYYKPM